MRRGWAYPRGEHDAGRTHTDLSRASDGVTSGIKLSGRDPTSWLFTTTDLIICSVGSTGGCDDRRPAGLSEVSTGRGRRAGAGVLRAAARATRTARRRPPAPRRAPRP